MDLHHAWSRLLPARAYQRRATPPLPLKWYHANEGIEPLSAPTSRYSVYYYTIRPELLLPFDWNGVFYQYPVTPGCWECVGLSIPPPHYYLLLCSHLVSFISTSKTACGIAFLISSWIVLAINALVKYFSTSPLTYSLTSFWHSVILVESVA